MSESHLKSWLLKDGLVRGPMLLLPFVLLILLLLLFRLYQLNSHAEQQLLLLQTEWQTSAESAPQKNNDRGVAVLVDIAATLRVWLQSGRHTELQAEQANDLAELATSMQNNTFDMPIAEFWQPFSSNLALLEMAVREGVISTQEARAAIRKLRGEYARLRQLAENHVIPTGQDRRESQIDPLLGRLINTQTKAARLMGWASLFALFGLALLALLLFGLVRAQVRRSEADHGTERKQQDAILLLLDEMAPLASGDLRVTATVSEATTGALADAFNFAVTELRRLVHAVTDSAGQVKASVTETRESAKQLAQASAVQAREIHRSSNYLNVMSDTMAQLSAHAAESSRMADTSVEQARVGAVALQKNVSGLQRIREQANMTTRLMQRLVESSNSIKVRMQDISEVAKRTDLLALNSTIRAAASMNTGNTNDLSQLAEEIAQLADVLNLATRDIAGLTDIIQQDASLTLSSMQRTTDELNTGQDKATEASESLNTITLASRELRALITDIAAKTLRQAGVVKQLSANMGVINGITRDSAMGLHDSAQALDELYNLATDLRQSVADFRLPAKSAAKLATSGAASRQLASCRNTDNEKQGDKVSLYG